MSTRTWGQSLAQKWTSCPSSCSNRTLQSHFTLHPTRHPHDQQRRAWIPTLKLNSDPVVIHRRCAGTESATPRETKAATKSCQNFMQESNTHKRNATATGSSRLGRPKISLWPVWDSHKTDPWTPGPPTYDIILVSKSPCDLPDQNSPTFKVIRAVFGGATIPWDGLICDSSSS